ncbi:MAG: penicillin-binding transpeptidase domain-containing protein, partial [Turicibacter sp.]
VRAIGGGSNQEGERTFNYATQIARQPGSTAKPIFAYGPAIEYLGWGTGKNITDELYSYESNKSQVVHNYNLIYQGTMTMRSALNQSLNVPAVKSFNAVGADKVQEFAKNLGMPVEDKLYESSAIGGVETGYSPLIMAGAYAAFGNGGIYNEPITIEKIVQSDGTTLYSDQKSEKVMKEETAYLMTNLLHSVMTDGTGRSANVKDMYLSGKTGTTNFPKEIREQYDMPYGAIRDSWFVGYSSEYTAAIWTGYDDTSKGKWITNSTQSTPWNLFKYVMGTMNTLNPVPYQEPKRPSNVVEVTIEKETDPTLLPSGLTPPTYQTKELFIKGTEPTEVSNRFQKLPTPQNVTGSYNGSTLNMSWDHISTYTIPSGDIDWMLGVHSSNQQKDGLGDYSSVDVPEHTLRMMRNQLQTIGATVYRIYGRTDTGNEVEIGITQSNSFSRDLSVYDMINYTDFFVRASYENYGALMSDNSNSIQITNLESYVKFVTIPNMNGWTQEQVNTWGQNNKINISYNEVVDATVPAGTVISTSPGANDKVEENKTLTVNIAGVPQLSVPNYASDTDFVAKYQAWGTLNGISISVSEKNDPTIPKGSLIGTNPGVGSIIAPGSTLTLTVSKGPEDVETGGDGGNTGGDTGGDGGNTGGDTGGDEGNPPTPPQIASRFISFRNRFNK